MQLHKKDVSSSGLVSVQWFPTLFDLNHFYSSIFNLQLESWTDSNLEMDTFLGFEAHLNVEQAVVK